MTQSEILSLPEAELYRRVAEALWPWDETRCRNCGAFLGGPRGCTEKACGLDWPGLNAGGVEASELQSWDGVGRMVEAMRERDFAVTMTMTFDHCKAYFVHKRISLLYKTGITEAQTPWESVARACLLALAESEAGK